MPNATLPRRTTRTVRNPLDYWRGWLYWSSLNGGDLMVLPVLPERNGKPYPFLSTPFSEASGGAYPRWRADGKELYYVAPSNNLMAAGISAPGGATTASIAPGQPVALFTANFARGPNRPQYDVARDGRFLGNVDLNDAATPPITLLQNWKPPK